MRLLPSDPDVATIVSRIQTKDLDLQPDFQRGEVWSNAKKQRLIDSILREWHVPPIHVIELKESARQEVLDGQQRLAAIRDFVNGAITVDGTIEPIDAGIKEIDGFRYDALPPQWRRRFDQFTIRVFRITDYAPGEPGELFYRLNQPTNLTAAEQRNAFFGPARQQVKELVEKLGEHGINKEFAGFSNSRMAYDDVIARLCCSTEAGTLAEKLTAASLAARYRDARAFTDDVIQRVTRAIVLLGTSRSLVGVEVRLNKATLFSWLWFVADLTATEPSLLDAQTLAEFIVFFESLRSNASSGAARPFEPELTASEWDAVRDLMRIFNDRASARVADISSVMARDAVLWIALEVFRGAFDSEVRGENAKLRALRGLPWPPQERGFDGESLVDSLIGDSMWGDVL